MGMCTLKGKENRCGGNVRIINNCKDCVNEASGFVLFEESNDCQTRRTDFKVNARGFTLVPYKGTCSVESIAAAEIKEGNQDIGDYRQGVKNKKEFGIIIGVPKDGCTIATMGQITIFNGLLNAEIKGYVGFAADSDFIL